MTVCNDSIPVILRNKVTKNLFLADFKGNTAQCGKSRFRGNLSSDDGTFSQMYFVYLKKK